MSNIIAVGQQAPDFTLKKGDQSFALTPENTFTLSAMKGQNVILAFYPADWSSVCSNQIAIYSQLKEEFASYDAVCFGISVDGTFCHAAFKEHHNMSIDLLCDFEPKGEISKLYGVYNSDLGVSERALYVIDKEGVIQYSYLSPMGENPGAKEILETLQKIN